MSRALESRIAKLEIVRCGPYVVRVSDPRSPSERAELELARREERQIAALPHLCRSIDDWAAKCRTPTSLQAFQGAAVSLATRISRLEGSRDTGAFFVVRGHSKAEHKERIAELIAANEATPQNLFICIMQFGKRE